MATTSNFGWNTPDDTDLVKDGALAIRTLGNNIDTSLVDLKGGTTGQILSKNSNSDLDYTWINNDQGDITEVQAGTGISVASGTGPVPVITNTVATEFDAKGDLVVGTGADTFDKLTAGADGDTLVADSSTTTGLRWQSDWNTGKNKIINGDFYWNQRNFTSDTTGAYHFDRWVTQLSGGTVTTTPQTFTLGAAPVSGYEAKNYVQIQTASQSGAGDYAILNQKIESVRTLAGQTATISFWAKATSGTPSIVAEVAQQFGTGGSPSAQVNTGSTKQTISTSWARYSFTFNVPSISGKTLGTNSNDSLSIFIWLSAGSNFNARTDTLGVQNNTFQIWGVQVEAGSVATPFTTATGTLAGELAACKRYYDRRTATDVYSTFSLGLGSSTTVAVIQMFPSVPMRAKPTSVEYANLGLSDAFNAVQPVTALALGTNTQGAEGFQLSATIGSANLTQFRPYVLLSNNSATGYVGFSAEL